MIPFGHNEPTLEHRPFPELIQFFVPAAMSILQEAPEKGAYQPEERL